MHLKRADPVLAGVIERVGPCRLVARAEGTHFDAMLRNIAYQQLSGSAAGTIFGRFLALYGGSAPLPAELIATPDEQLRAVGLSRQKVAYMKDLAERVESEDVLIHSLHELADDEIIEALTRVKGIGKWTAQMFLMFRLGRPNVLPDLDLGVQKGIKLAYGLRTLPTPERVRKIGKKWEPYCSVASWYMWRILDLPNAQRAK